MTKRRWFFLLLLALFVAAAVLIAIGSRVPAGEAEEAAVPQDSVAQEPEEETQDAQETEAGQEEQQPQQAQEARRAAETVVQAAPPVPTAQSSSDVTGAVHFVDCAFRTGGNATIGIPAAIVQEGGIVLEPGDEIAIFTPDGATCTGAVVWNGSNTAISAWGDDPQSDAVDGLQEGDELRFRIWDQSAGEEIDISAAAYELGDGKYTADGIYVVSRLATQ